VGTVRTLKPGDRGYRPPPPPTPTQRPPEQTLPEPVYTGPSKEDFEKAIESVRPAITAALGGDNSRVTRHIMIFWSHLLSNDALKLTTPQSYAGAVLSAAQLGLEVGPLNECSVQTRQRQVEDTWETVAVFSIDYPGWLDIIYRNTDVLTVKADAVRKQDQIEHESGDREFLRHTFDPSADRGEIVSWYAYARLKGAFIYEMISRKEVERIRDQYSRKKDRYTGELKELKGAWKDELEGMGEKTVLKRLTKWLRKRGKNDLQLANELDDNVRIGEVVDEETGEIT
jgi:phage RecT family recombinase